MGKKRNLEEKTIWCVFASENSSVGKSFSPGTWGIFYVNHPSPPSAAVEVIEKRAQEN